jgi:hypothetical protein
MYVDKRALPKRTRSFREAFSMISEERFVTKKDLDAGLDATFADVMASIYRALLIQAIGVVGLFFALYKFFY